MKKFINNFKIFIGGMAIVIVFFSVILLSWFLIIKLLEYKNSDGSNEEKVPSSHSPFCSSVKTGKLVYLTMAGVE